MQRELMHHRHPANSTKSTNTTSHQKQNLKHAFSRSTYFCEMCEQFFQSPTPLNTSKNAGQSTRFTTAHVSGSSDSFSHFFSFNSLDAYKLRASSCSISVIFFPPIFKKSHRRTSEVHMNPSKS